MAASPASGNWLRIAAALVGLAALGAGGWYASGRARSASADETRSAGANGPSAITVDVVTPRPGGIQRVCVQPGTVEPFDSADLYAKVSGYLAEQAVDIGSRVKAGDVLARISVPEYEKQVERDEAQVRDSQAKVKQMEAHLRAAQAEARAADAAVVLAKVMVKAKSAFRHYREKQLERVKGLFADKAVDAKLVDEQEDYFLSAQEAENAANEQVNTARERAAAAGAKIGQAEADLDEAKADVGVAQAELSKAKVLLGYTVIRSPYTGLVTKRSFHVGDFIKAADQGGVVPMLAVERVDLMRVVVQVPDRDVPFVRPGAPAVVEIDALPGVTFASKDGQTVAVARSSGVEDPSTRTMRTEIDVPNPKGVLAHGMYGRVSITLDAGAANALRLPSSALVGKAEGGRGSVRVVRDGTVHLVPVRYATDNGVEAEIVSGLTPADRVVTRSTAPVEEGTAVAVHEEPAGGH
ncbi:MAG: efflux RND transporter periplasmic adaptor subunit [Planctomycetes bacterium]|nr:efflux RND transporter periplasmic adaptor subunit [Planctomycetota bacterium]